ncbi:hypothetical protein [Flavobacterium limi]|uniref:DUF4374 domain-containing protein n=1 Tax=Flavobacterium limi TaxID=2045105 RepID=A0ABQ1TRB1_9FLAO|nr:hypothetical protein [Flavobacterium limi]GGE99941.1 hypothetical protein GCM10011518_06680 [Flavobacterium limi]
MKKNLFRIALLSTVITALTLGSCSSDDNNSGTDPNPPADDTRWISITGSFPDESGSAGDGGTRAFAITTENAANPDYEVDLFKMSGEKYVVGFALKSDRTARVQASEDGKFLYNIQYTGTDGGVFNKYSVGGAEKYTEVGSELNTASILGTAPRWVKAAEGIGVGVFSSTVTTTYTGTVPNFVYGNRDCEVKIAVIDLNNTSITNTAIFNFPWSDAERAAGYSVGRIDVPVLNQAKNKLYIGCNVAKVDPTKTPTPNASGVPVWPSDAANINGTKTLVVDYPSLRNPKVITSTLTKVNNHGYRTMTQYVGTDGHLYQGVFSNSGGYEILRISKTTNDYDPSYHFNLNTALGITGANIKALRYVKDGIAVALYTITGTPGGYVALLDLNTPANSVKLATEVETDAALSTTLGQFQNIGLVGDNVYLPLTPAGKDGNIYIVNYKTKTIKKGAKLKAASGSFYLGAY